MTRFRPANAGATILPPSPQPSPARGEGVRESARCAPKARPGREGSGRMHPGRPWSRRTLSAGLLAGLLSLPLATPPAGAFTLEEFQFSDPAKAEEFRRLVTNPIVEEWVKEMNAKGFDGAKLLAGGRELVERYRPKA